MLDKGLYTIMTNVYHSDCTSMCGRNPGIICKVVKYAFPACDWIAVRFVVESPPCKLCGILNICRFAVGVLHITIAVMSVQTGSLAISYLLYIYIFLSLANVGISWTRDLCSHSSAFPGTCLGGKGSILHEGYREWKIGDSVEQLHLSGLISKSRTTRCGIGQRDGQEGHRQWHKQATCQENCETEQPVENIRHQTSLHQLDVFNVRSDPWRVALCHNWTLYVVIFTGTSYCFRE